MTHTFHYSEEEVKEKIITEVLKIKNNIHYEDIELQRITLDLYHDENLIRDAMEYGFIVVYWDSDDTELRLYEFTPVGSETFKFLDI